MSGTGQPQFEAVTLDLPVRHLELAVREPGLNDRAAACSFRAVSTYLTAQYVLKMKGFTPDWELKNFKGMYAKVKQINSDFAQRLQEIKGNDAIVNALVRLDMFAQAGSFMFSEDWVKRLESIFSAYLDE